MQNSNYHYTSRTHETTKMPNGDRRTKRSPTIASRTVGEQCRLAGIAPIFVVVSASGGERRRVAASGGERTECGVSNFSSPVGAVMEPFVQGNSQVGLLAWPARLASINRSFYLRPVAEAYGVQRGGGGGGSGAETANDSSIDEKVGSFSK